MDPRTASCTKLSRVLLLTHDLFATAKFLVEDVGNSAEEAIATDQDEVREVDDDYRCRNEHLFFEKDVFVEHNGQRKGDGASKSAVRHDELADRIQLRRSDKIRHAVEYHDH